MTNIEKLSDLASRFQTNLAYYKDAKRTIMNTLAVLSILIHF